MQLLILHEGKAGHTGQSRAVAKAFAMSFPAEAVEIFCKLRIGALQRPLEFLLNQTGGRLPLCLFHLFHKSDHLPEKRPDLIVSAGGGTRHANAWLGTAWHCPNIFCGETRRLHPSLFKAIITAYERFSGKSPYIISPTPVSIDRNELARMGNDYRERSGTTGTRYWSLLCGGDGGGYSYNESDWVELGKAIGEISAKSDVRWLVTTSRRTGKAAESILAGFQSTGVIAATCFASHRDNDITYREILGASERHFCTEDSHMMISEAIASGAPVHTLQPENAHPEESNAYFLDIYERSGWISRHAIHNASGYDFQGSSVAKQSAPPVMDSLSTKLAEWWKNLQRA